MIKVRKGWVALGILCVVLTLWAWEMVAEFRSGASAFGTRADLTPRDETLRRPLRVVTSGLDPAVALRFNELSLSAKTMSVISPESIGRADAVLVLLPHWESAANVDPGILPPEISFDLRQMPATEPVAFHAAERPSGGLTTYVVLNKAALSATTPFCMALMAHDFLRLWAGEATFFSQFDHLRVHECLAAEWSSLPPAAPPF